MSPVLASGGVAVLVGVAVIAGLLWRSRQGRVTKRRHPEVDFSEFGVGPAPTTLLQFSTEFCAKCPATTRLLGTIAEQYDGVDFVEYDLTHDAVTAGRLHISQTPTVMVIDRDGDVVARIGGAPRAADVHSLLTERGHRSATAKFFDERKKLS